MNALSKAIEKLARILDVGVLPGGYHTPIESDDTRCGRAALQLFRASVGGLAFFMKSCTEPGRKLTFGLSKEPGGFILVLYGVLQAVIVNQDALNELHRVFMGGPFIPAKLSAWREIRTLRNLIAGHPARHTHPIHGDPMPDLAILRQVFQIPPGHPLTAMLRVETLGLTPDGTIAVMTWIDEVHIGFGTQVDLDGLLRRYEAEAIRVVKAIAKVAKTMPRGEEGYVPNYGAEFRYVQEQEQE